jgi:DNA-binding IscR family transcriptional regulator
MRQDTSCKESWPATLLFKDLPCIKMTTCPRKAEKKKMPLMLLSSIELVGLYVSSFEEYFGNGKLNPDRLAAMALHPMFATKGFESLCVLRPVGDEPGPSNGLSLKKEATELIVDAVHKAIEGSRNIEDQLGLHSGDDDDDDDDDEPMSKLEQLASNYSLKKTSSALLLSERERAEKAVKDFMEQDFNP